VGKYNVMNPLVTINALESGAMTVESGIATARASLIAAVRREGRARWRQEAGKAPESDEKMALNGVNPAVCVGLNRFLAKFKVTMICERNWLKQRLMKIKLMKNGPPESASARVLSGGCLITQIVRMCADVCACLRICAGFGKIARRGKG